MSMIVNVGSDESDSASYSGSNEGNGQEHSEECASTGVRRGMGFLDSVLKKGRSVSWILPEDELRFAKEELDLEHASKVAAQQALLEDCSSTFWNEIIMEEMEREENRLQQQWRRAVERVTRERLDQYGNYIQPGLDPEERLRQQFEADVVRLAREQAKQREDDELLAFRALCLHRERRYGKYGEKKRKRKDRSGRKTLAP